MEIAIFLYFFLKSLASHLKIVTFAAAFLGICQIHKKPSEVFISINYCKMNKIVSKKMFSEKVACLEVEAPLIARSRKAGHFVIVRLDEKGERKIGRASCRERV